MPAAAAGPEAKIGPSLRDALGFATIPPSEYDNRTKLRATLLPTGTWRDCSCNVACDRSADVASETARTDIQGLYVTPGFSIRSLCPVYCARLHFNAVCIQTPRSCIFGRSPIVLDDSVAWHIDFASNVFPQAH